MRSTSKKHARSIKEYARSVQGARKKRARSVQGDAIILHLLAFLLAALFVMFLIGTCKNIMNSPARRNAHSWISSCSLFQRVFDRDVQKHHEFPRKKNARSVQEVARRRKKRARSRKKQQAHIFLHVLASSCPFLACLAFSCFFLDASNRKLPQAAAS